MFDEQGNVLVLRPDMTVPIARLVATRYAHAEPPLRFCYFAHAYRGVRPQRGQSREFLQAGVELIGSPGPRGHRRGADGPVRGARRRRAGDLPDRARGRVAVPVAARRPWGSRPSARELILAELAGGDFVGVEREVRALGLGDGDVELLLRVARTRGGAEVLEDLSDTLHEALAGMREVQSLLAPEVAARIIFDLGLVRSLGYYTGAVFQVYDPAYGVPIGSGGRYDELLGSFGRPLPAVGLRAQRRAAAHRADRRGARPRLRRSADDACASPSPAARCSPTRSTSSIGWGSTPARSATTTASCCSRTPGSSPCGPRTCPTYVEAGAADLGITGKDVLMEQSEREVYELLDLGYGHCRMVLAGVAGEDRAAEALRRLGVVRIATKYPRIAARHFLETGRQAEIVEVKGSVELAPLTGLVEAIVDLTATGTTLRENGLVVREEIAVCTARLIANPVAHKLQGARTSTPCWSGSMQCERLTLAGDPRGAGRGAARAGAGARVGRRSRWPRSSPASAPAATTRCATTRASSTPAARRRRRCRFPRPSSTPPASASTTTSAPAWSRRSPT